ncbi:hypothetical protein [Paramagnetospirillum magneticum]|uniref:hypothetical protein n=1 Tax=Paramagnetospirillum magneticum TaxID=84159 RepID=UPI0011D05E90|nr:hypothetical protein [Paramagnetospirillum magneticum]
MAHAIEVKRTDLFSKCEKNYQVDWYISREKATRIQPFDAIFRGTKDKDPGLWFIRAGETKVTIWENAPGAIADGSCSSWFRSSNVVPAAGTLEPDGTNFVVVGTDGCDINAVKRRDEALPDIQIRYDVAYRKELGYSDEPASAGTEYFYYVQLASTPHDKNYSTKKGAGEKTNIPDQRFRKWGDIEMFPSTCQNIHLHYCGDGVVDTAFGEECDPKMDMACTPTCKKQ